MNPTGSSEDRAIATSHVTPWRVGDRLGLLPDLGNASGGSETRNCPPLEEPNRKVEVAAVFPGAANQVDAVVEGDGANGRADADAGARGVAEHEGVEVLRLDPDVAGIEKESALPDAAEGDAQLERAG